MATVGGMASTNAHGMRAVKYGPTSAWVLGLEVVMPNGEIIETGSVGSRAKQSSAGLELTKLIVGAEGILGVITKLRLKLMPIPPAKAIVMAVFDVLENAGQAVQVVPAGRALGRREDHGAGQAAGPLGGLVRRAEADCGIVGGALGGGRGGGRPAARL
jgi:glycolate oxidase